MQRGGPTVIRNRFIFRGRVQGVGFRWFAARTARQHSLTGYVRNLDDGSVECEVQGSEQEIAAFLDRVRQGNGYASVDDLSVAFLEVIQGESYFAIDQD